MTAADIGILITHLHPVVIHFPIAMIISATGAELLVCVFRVRTLEPAVRYCLHFGAIGAVLAMLTGWLKFVVGPLSQVARAENDVLQHRMFGTIAGVAVLFSAVLYEVSRAKVGKYSWLYRSLLLISTLLIGYAAHLGGELIYGHEYWDITSS